MSITHFNYRRNEVDNFHTGPERRAIGKIKKGKISTEPRKINHAEQCAFPLGGKTKSRELGKFKKALPTEKHREIYFVADRRWRLQANSATSTRPLVSRPLSESTISTSTISSTTSTTFQIPKSIPFLTSSNNTP